ncbi:hypothetical protein OMP38_00915 [Cohnella ginsengisoli]|uniref:Uncharacterized protein n=1 Tax=Cohnella ginsengisoli TaxID=425004 RepID=A0A9X4QKM5_9BACL|nr:hypothetical protein [Cohnella ginsengisoli]MDG0789575.1 hypothetical protein [Cohnella ginsengisoli]
MPDEGDGGDQGEPTPDGGLPTNTEQPSSTPTATPTSTPTPTPTPQATESTGPVARATTSPTVLPTSTATADPKVKKREEEKRRSRGGNRCRDRHCGSGRSLNPYRPRSASDKRVRACLFFVYCTK